MSATVIAALITSCTTVACLVYTNHRQIGAQSRKIEELTVKQTEQITAHVTDKTGGAK